MLERLRFDALTALRSLWATPAPTVAAVLTLAVAAGVNLAMFGLIDRALLSPPAFVAAPERVFTLSFEVAEGPQAGRMTTTSWVTFRTIRDNASALGAAAAFQRSATSIVLDGSQRQVNAMLVSGAYFDLLGARPMIGAGISRANDDPGASPAAVVSQSFWRSALGSDRDVIGRRFALRGIDFVVAGVMPAGFSGHSSADVDLWVPFASAMRGSPGWDQNAFQNILSIVARLAPDQTTDAASAQAGAAINRRVVLSPIVGAEIAADERRVAWWLGGVSVLVFVIGLANAGTLLVVRAARRRQDAAIRAALGASRGRLTAQALMEAALIAAAATGVSLALAPTMDDAVRRVLFPGVIGASGLRDVTLMTAFAAGVIAAVVAAAAGLSQLPPAAGARDLAGAGRAGTRRTRTMTGLLLVQMTLSVMLLAGTAMFGASFHNLAAQDFGMKMEGVVIADFEQSPGSVPGQGGRFADVLDQVRALPGVEIATVIDAVPFTGFNVPPISVPGRAEPPNVGGQLPFLLAATPELLRILDVPLIEGRRFTAADDKGARVVIVNEAMARGIWPGESAVGKCIRIGFDPDFDPATADGPPTPSAAVPCREIVGVVGDVRQRSLVPTASEARLMQYYVPFSQVPVPPFAPQQGPAVRGLMIRSSVPAEILAPQIRRLVLAQNQNLPFVRVMPYAQLLDRQMRPWRLGTTLLGLFSALALAVAAVGLYAAFAHAVAERRREMAIRIAIGAQPGGVLRMILREAIVLAAAGALLGCAGAMYAGRGVQSLLFGTTPADPLVLASAAGAMILVAAAATLLPARSAAKADPNSLLRVQ